MATEIKATLEELKGIGQECHSLNQRIKELRARKKELEKKVLDFLIASDKPGVRDGNIVFLATEKNARSRKKKVDVVRDTTEVLQRHGVQGNLVDVLKELEEARKGEANSVSVLKMKAAGIYG